MRGSNPWSDLNRRPDLGKVRVPTEDQEQRAVCQFLDLARVLYCAVPNGGQRGRVEAARLIGQGVKRGVPDLLIFDSPTRWEPGDFYDVPLAQEHPGEMPCGVAIEMKRLGATLSKISSDQLQWGTALARLGWLWVVCRGADEAITVLHSLGIGNGVKRP